MALRHPLAAILLASFALRALFAAILPLGTDEAYALAVGRSFSISFFDHPPLGFWAPALAEWVFGTNAPFVLRLPSLILGTLALWGLYLCGDALGGQKAGLWAAGLGAVAPMVAFSGVMILPDAALYPALMFTAYALIRLVQGYGGRYWVYGGLALATALASKYQAGLLPISLLIWMLTTPIGRAWFARPGFYLALSLSLIGLAPVLIWNLQNDWASFAFHTGRAGGGFAPANFALMALGQAIYLLPPILVWAALALLDRRLWREPVQRMLAMIALGPILLFNAIYLVSQNSLAHWTMAGWIMLIPVIALRISRAKAAKIWVAIAALPSFGAALVVGLHLATGFATRFTTAGRDLPAWDNAPHLIPMRATQRITAQSGILQGADFIAARDWIEAGHIAAALGPNPPMRVLSNAPHHFGHMPQPAGRGVFFAMSTLPNAEADTPEALAFARQIDPAAQLLQTLTIPRGARDYFALIAISISLPAQD